ncbi:hypothetical protein BU26DRAFT_457490 [Trematosphaeria pertusa]|uniref:Uncharacterized protein n=1 Tax=Trematosphaeria pertusa TaxID=390896 RepID=A0A6A6IGZ8_9PLEO|nr:uncharacterized protein BU26DRAFT_457490 [Trematosphaeria pertusa]KAF2249437.1 hypothetical protein BU26DRAFT_457490 [Trematosphaeria pertusa]
MYASDKDAGQYFKPKREAAQSPFENYPDDLNTWYWHNVPSNKIAGYMFELHWTYGVDRALGALGVSDRSTLDGGDNEIIQCDHYNQDENAEDVSKQRYRVEDKEYRVTGARFVFSINSAQGVLIAMDRLSPKHAAQKRNPPIPDSGLPPIQQFSDVAWLFWTTLGGNNNNNRPIRYFMSITITNGETEAVIAKALNDNGLTLGPWPGHFFEWDTDEFKAILGTSNGQGFGYLLVEHKAQLGNRFITRVQVFHGDTWHKAPCLIFYVEPQPPPEAIPESSSSSSAANAKRTPIIQSDRIRKKGNNFERVHVLRSKL